MWPWNAKRSVSALIMLFAAGLALVSLWRLAQPPSEAPNPGTISVRLAWLPGATFAGDYVAQQKGYWTNEELNVVLYPGGFGFEAIKLVAAGADTFGVTSAPQLLQARAQGVPIVAIAATIPDSPIGWVSKKSSGIVMPLDFKGKKIGAQFGTHTEITFVALLSKLGLPLNDVERIPVQFDPAPFVSGAIDVLPVYIIDQPIDMEAQGIELNVIDPRKYSVAFSNGNLYFTTEKELRDHPDVVRKFLEGAKKGWMDAYANRDTAVQAITTAAPDLDKAILKKKIDVTFAFIVGSQPKYLGLYPISEEKLKHDVEMLSSGSDFPPNFDVKSAFDNSFLPN